MYRQGMEDRYLSFFEGYWRIGCGDGVGTFGCWMMARDDALHPNAIQTSWQQFDGAAFVAAPTVMVMLEGRLHMEQRVNHRVLYFDRH